MSSGWTRRSFLAGAAAFAAAGLNGPAQGQRASIAHLAHDYTPSHPIAVRLREAADRIGSRGGGRFQVLVFPDGQINTNLVLTELQLGGLEFAALSSFELASAITAAIAPSVGFAFPEHAARWSALDGELGAHLRASLEPGGLTAFPKAMDGGYRYVTSLKAPVVTPADLKGFRIRTPIDQLRRSMFSSLGAVTLFAGLDETYVALENEALDGQDEPLAEMVRHKLFEVQRYCALTRHSFDCVWIVANTKALESLFPDIRAIVEEEFDRAATLQRADMLTAFEDQKDVLALTGMSFADVDPRPFREALRASGYYARWQAALGAEPWARLEAAAGPLA
jgi:TRAP-type C4-dicarboxylate transport system substrate-binding protein